VSVTVNNKVSSVSCCSQEGFPPIFDMGNDFEERKSNLFSIQKLWTEKYPSSRFNHLSTDICVYLTFKYRNIKFYLYLEGGRTSVRRRCVALVGSRRRICVKLSIISFLCCMRIPQSNSLKGSPVPSYLFSPAMRDLFCM
jgi:hypothetical protein